MSSAIVVIVALSAMAAPADAVMHLPPASSFLEYLELFGRTYGIDSPEGKLRRALFEQRAHAIRRQNEKPGALWRAGFNHLTDRTHDELRSLRGSRASPRHAALVFVQEPQQDAMAALPSDFPENKDWSDLKSISVIDQGECGSCWAVAAAYLLRTHYEIHTQTVKEFSVQDLLNCVPNPFECGGSGGCGGATVEVALAYVKNVSLGSLSLTSDEPYTGSDDVCKRASFLAGEGSLRDSRQHQGVSSGEGVNLAGYQRLPANNPILLLRALLKGPVAVSASASTWNLYNTGVFDGCSGDDAWTVDHAVVMVGFGVDSVSGHRYWKVMNSWGPLWGEDGMMRLLRLSPEQEADNCGWNTNPSAGIACKPYPSKQWTCGMCGILLDPVTPRLL